MLIERLERWNQDEATLATGRVRLANAARDINEWHKVFTFSANEAFHWWLFMKSYAGVVCRANQGIPSDPSGSLLLQET